MQANLLEYNTLLEQKRFSELPSIDLFRLWVWETDPNEEIIPKILMNTNHITGLLYCRRLALTSHRKAETTIQLQGHLQVNSVHPLDMNLKQLDDALENFCIEWPAYIQEKTASKNMFQYIELCLYRFGLLASFAWPDTVLNDPLITELHPGTDNQRRLTPCALRKFLIRFLILYRHFYLYTHAVKIEPKPFDCKIRNPHVQASMDAFHLLCMHYLIPVAARLQYKNEFRGMYNHISQVMYKHNPKYERIARMSLDELEKTGDPMHVLPALWELHPEVQVYYEEDHFYHEKVLPQWAWLIVAGRVYLLQPDKTIYYSENVASLYDLYLKKK